MKLAPYNARGINGRARRAASLAGRGEGRRRLPAGTEGAGREVSPERQSAPGTVRSRHGQKPLNGVAVLVRDQDPRETRPGLPGDPDDSRSRYIEAAIDGIVVGCLYLPNGNPAPGPKFDDKLRWFERLHAYADELLELDVPVALVGNFNVCRQTSTSTSRSGGWTTRCFVRT